MSQQPSDQSSPSRGDRHTASLALREVLSQPGGALNTRFEGVGVQFSDCVLRAELPREDELRRIAVRRGSRFVVTLVFNSDGSFLREDWPATA